MLVTTDALPVVWWTIGISTCTKSMQEGANFILSFVGVHIPGEFSQTHLVRKFVASCDIKFLLRNPPSTGTKRMCGTRVGTGTMFGFAGMRFGLAVCGDHRGAIIGVDGGLGISQRGLVGMIWGTLPGMLFHVCHECILLLNFKVLFWVGLGAFMMGGASVIQVSIGTLLWSSSCLLGAFTLCSTLCSTIYWDWGTYGVNWMSARGRSHSCDRCVKQRSGAIGGVADSLAVTRDMIWVRFGGGSSCNVVMSSSITSWRCS